MSEDGTPSSQTPPSGAKEGGGRRPPQNNRGSKKSIPNSRPSSTGPNQNGSAAPNSGSGALKPSRSAGNTGKSGVNSPQTAPVARLAAGDTISRPSSTDTSGARNNSEGGSGRREGRQRQVSRGGGQGSASTKKAQGGNSNNSTNTSAKSVPSSGQPPAPTPGAKESGSAALSSLQRVITDLKSISPNPPSAGGNVRSNSSGSSPADNNPPPRHRKSASAGAISGNPVASTGYANLLGPMQEDVEDGYSYVESEEYNDQPGFSQPQQQPQQTPQGYGGAMRNMQQQPMGSFAAPRFQAQPPPHTQMQPQDAYGTQGEVIGPSGRPQLAPNFTFGTNRRPRAPSSDGDDVNFQFPPQQSQLPSLPPSQYDNANVPRRTNEVPAGVTPLMAEQVCSIVRRIDQSTINPSLFNRLLSRIRSRRCSSSSSNCSSSRSHQIRSWARLLRRHSWEARAVLVFASPCHPELQPLRAIVEFRVRRP